MPSKLIYRNPLLYEIVMRLLYGRHYQARSRVIADLIEPHSSVVDLCCGSALLYRDFLRQKNVDYTGLDISFEFVEQLNRRGIRARQSDLRSSPTLPPADYAVMQSSLCYFLPDPHHIIDRMLAAAGKAVIIAEPIRNLSTSSSPLLATIAVRLSGPGGDHAQRFDERSFDDVFARYSSRIAARFKIPGGREKVYVLNGMQPGLG